jgi:cell division protein FtsL
MIKNIVACILAIAIPLALFATVAQTSRYVRLESEVKALDRTQYEIIAINRRLISGITVLSTPERIERVALEDLKMRKARPDEITRIALTKGDLGG